MIWNRVDFKHFTTEPRKSIVAIFLFNKGRSVFLSFFAVICSCYIFDGT